MIFDNCQRRISEITDQQLIDLIGNQEENQWIDFKQEGYHRDSNDPEKHKREICKDITAMANAEGGYIFIGVQETGKVAQSFHTVNNPDKISASINAVCLQSIHPRIPNLEVKPRSFDLQGRCVTIVIIHVPPSDLHPHGFVWKNSTHFVKRYGDHTREYPMSELSDAFSARHYSSIVGPVNDKLDTMLRIMQLNRTPQIVSEDNALTQQTVEDLLQLMTLRFQEAILGEPFYRILAVPKTLNSNSVLTDEPNIQNILRNPRNVRRTGFGFIGVKTIKSSLEGIKGIDVWGYEAFILRNGFIEIRRPLSSYTFKYQREEMGISIASNWLHPYAVCELPVTFMRLVQAIFSAAGINSPFFVQQEYHNLSGFVLAGGNPLAPIFGLIEEFQTVYLESHALGRLHLIEPEFFPDQVAYELAKEIYAAFELDSDQIAAFDAHRRFIF